MRSSPVPRFYGGDEVHPHYLREAGLNPHLEMALHQPFKLVKPLSDGVPPA